MSICKRKKPAKLLPRTIDALRADGWAADVVERRNQFAALDFLGFADIVALKAGVVVAIQVTTRHNAESHLVKIAAAPGAKLWKEQGGLIQLWLWEKKGHRWRVMIDHL